MPAPQTVTVPVKPVLDEEALAGLKTSLAGIPQVTVDDGELGSLIEDPKRRKAIYSVWTLIGLVLVGLGAGMSAGLAAVWGVYVALTQTITPDVARQLHPWLPLVLAAVFLFAFVSGAYAVLSPHIASLARSNTTIGPTK